MLSIKPFYCITLLVILQSISRHCLCDDSDDSLDSSEATVATSTTSTSTPNDGPCTICPCFSAQTDFSQCLNDDCRYISTDGSLTLLTCDDLLVAIDNIQCGFIDSENNINEINIDIPADQVQCCQDILDTLYTYMFEPSGCTTSTAVTTTTTPPPATTNDVPCTCPCWGAQTDFSQCLNDDCRYISTAAGLTLLECEDLVAGITSFQCVLDSENWHYHIAIPADQRQCCQDILDALYTDAFEPAGCTTNVTVTTTTPPPVTTSTTAASTTNDVPCSICPCFGAQTDFSQCLNDDCQLSIEAIPGVTFLGCDDLKTAISDGTDGLSDGCIFTDSENGIHEFHGPLAADQLLCCQAILGVLYTNAFEPAGCTTSGTAVTTTTPPPVTTPLATLPEGGEECPCDWPEDITCGADANGCSYREVGGGSSITCDTSRFVAVNGFDCFEKGDNSGSSSIGNTFEYNACRNALYGIAVSEGCKMEIS